MKKNIKEKLNPLEFSIKNKSYKTRDSTSGSFVKEVEVKKSIEILEKALKEKVFSNLESNDLEDK